jgi:hypothetical protein
VPPRRVNGRGRGSESSSSRRIGSVSRQRFASLPRQAVSRRLRPKEEPMTSTTPKHPADAIPDDLILAAIARAERHCGNDVSRVPIWEITAHLNIGRRSAAARHVRSRLAALEAVGRLERSRRHGIPVWGLTPDGRRRLRRADRAASVPALPESPQHASGRRLALSLRRRTSVYVASCDQPSMRPPHCSTAARPHRQMRGSS